MGWGGKVKKAKFLKPFLLKKQIIKMNNPFRYMCPILSNLLFLSRPLTKKGSKYP